MVEKYVITGGPCVGKTSIVLGLEQRGEHVVRECAEDFIRLQQAKGIRQPWLDPNFQNELLNTHLRRERSIRDFDGKVFIDGGLIDFFVYFRLNGSLMTKDTKEEILSETRYFPYQRIFFVERLKKYETTPLRRETEDEALRTGEMIRREYDSFGFHLLDIPPLDLDGRINFILSKL